MEIELEPEPDDETREALERALERLAAQEPRPSAWWRAGVAENAGVADVEP